VVTLVAVNGLAHAWSGGAAGKLFSDGQGARMRHAWPGPSRQSNSAPEAQAPARGAGATGLPPLGWHRDSSRCEHRPLRPRLRARKRSGGRQGGRRPPYLACRASLHETSTYSSHLP
jgi:hypothetical protein